MTNAIEVTGLKKKYQAFALDNLNLTLPMGSIMGFIGENGAGKSTTIKAMLGLIHTDRGTIRLLGKDPIADRSVMEDVGVVLDTNTFLPEMSAKQLSTVLSSVYRHWDNHKFSQFLSSFQIDPLKKCKEYSRGMTMKLSIAAALSHNARLLILDEATGGLDPIVRDDILDLLYEFIQDERHSVLLSSHITGDLEKIADYITFIHQGKLVLTAQKDELLESYGLFSCSETQLSQLSAGCVSGYRKSEFGVTALVKRARLPKGYACDNATLDDIMLYLIKGKKL